MRRLNFAALGALNRTLSGWRRSLVSSAIALIAVAVAMAIGSPVPAQTPPAPAPKAQPKAQPKAPAQQPAPTGPAAAVNAGAPELPPLTYTPWTKLCRKGPEADAKQVCATGRQGFLDMGFMVIDMQLIEPEGVTTKLLQITLPLMMVLSQGTRVTVDQGQPMNAQFTACFQTGCMAEIEASGELIGKLKKGQGLMVQGIHAQRGLITVPLPLAEFAKANEGPPMDPKAFEERMKKLGDQFLKKQQELQQQGH
jgi:invasion protein IalB